MDRSPLAGCSILVVEDEPLIIMDIESAFDGSGAELRVATSLKEGLLLAEQDGFSLAILDHGLPDGESTDLYAALQARGIPFIIYTGYEIPEDQQYGGVVVRKPAIDGDLRAAAAKLVELLEK